MIWTQAKWAPLRSVKTDLADLVQALSKEAEPVLGPSRKRQAGHLGITVNRFGSSTKPPTFDLLGASSGFPFSLDISSTEVLKTQHGLYVLTVRQRPTGWIFSTQTGLSDASTFRPELWIHYIGTETTPTLMSDLEAAVFACYRVRCRQFYPDSPRFDQVKQRLTSPPPIRGRGLAAAAGTLADHDRRDALKRLRQARLLRLSDFESHLSKPAVDVQALASAGLVYVRSAATKKVVRATVLAANLLNGSRWHSILVTESPHRAGIPPNQIRVEHELDGHEVDILANIMGKLAVFELKDGPFSVGHAYSLAAKIAIIQPDLVFIISSGTIEERAKRVLTSNVIDEDTGIASVVLGLRRPPAPSVSSVEGAEFETPLLEAISLVHRGIAERILDESLSTGVLKAADILNQL